jgi:hypothetical protein
MADLNDEESEWDHLNRTNWRGLGLTDPIKSVEVGPKFNVFLLAVTRFLPG